MLASSGESVWKASTCLWYSLSSKWLRKNSTASSSVSFLHKCWPPFLHVVCNGHHVTHFVTLVVGMACHRGAAAPPSKKEVLKLKWLQTINT